MYYLQYSLLFEDFIKQALKEDIGHGDIATSAIINNDKKIKAVLKAKEDCILCGLQVFELVFKILDKEIKFSSKLKDGDKVKTSDIIGIIEGKASVILTGERTALNFIQRMSAVAACTNKFVKAVEPYNVKIADTRKTTPNFRVFEKYAVVTGGGYPHRFGLFDCAMIKDNHIKAAGGITQAVKILRNKISHTTKIEVEVENLKEVKEAIENIVDIIMLDNMTLQEAAEAVKLINGKAITEISGRINLDNIAQYAKTGVDYISTSAITAKAGIIDISLDFD
jgi:nicotinate-nucleotide pyrophosphorylase (carboxylating)